MNNDKQTSDIPEPRILAWEVTRACNLACRHCRASAHPDPFPGELSHEEAMDFIDSIPEAGSPILIFTGGEPLLRPDLYSLIQRARQNGLSCAIAPNGTLLKEETAGKLADSGIERVSISLDAPDAKGHNAFRGVPGAFEASLRGIRNLRRADLPFQINTTVTSANLHLLRSIHDLALEEGAVAWHIFLLVPTGRASSMSEEVISAQEYERVLNWLYDFKKESPLQLKATCAPQFHRILRQRAASEGLSVSRENFGLDAVSKGCLAGTGFCFVSHAGRVQPCGYLELECGDLRKAPFPWIWKNSPRLAELRDISNYRGKCGECEYVRVCGGCRARALSMDGDYLGQEPLCDYLPKRGAFNGQHG